MVGLTGLEPVTPRLSSACSNQLSYKPKNGGAEETRTPDILLAKQALYQLSYSPKSLELFCSPPLYPNLSKNDLFRSLKTELCNSIHQSFQQAGMFDRTGIHADFVLPRSAGTSSP